jgi:hypothetical protein
MLALKDPDEDEDEDEDDYIFVEKLRNCISSMDKRR